LIKRTISTYAEYNKVDSYVKTIKAKNFTTMKISDSSLVKRRISYCEVASTKNALSSKFGDNDMGMKANISQNEITIERRPSWTQSSNIDNTEASTWDAGASKIAVFNFKKVFDPKLISLKKVKNIETTKSWFITPIKKKKRKIYPTNSTSTKYIETTPMIIKSMNTTPHSIYDSERKTQRDVHISNKVSNMVRSPNTWIKTNTKKRL